MSEVIIAAEALRVVFAHRNDRYAHRVEVFDAATGVWTMALESVEGSDAEAWPPSPPFQQLHVEQRPTGPIVFLVGMAGKSHWSAAVEVAPDRRSVMFDVAVRCQLPPSRLGSEYVSAGKGVSQATLAIARVGGEMIAESRIEPPGRPSSAPATISWKYQVVRAGDNP